MSDETSPKPTAEDAARSRAVAALQAEQSSLVKRNENNNARLTVIAQQLAALQPK